MGDPTPENGLISAGYVDPRELGPNSPIRDLAGAYLQELRDKGRSETTILRYERFLIEFLDFVERDGAAPRVRDVDVRVLKAYASHLTRRRLLAGRDSGKRPISAASKNLHLIALRGLLKFGVLLDLPMPGPEKVELAKAPDPSPDARHLDEPKLGRLLDESYDDQTADGLRNRALLEFLVATGCRVSEMVALDRAKLELDPRAKTPGDGIRIADEVTVFGKGGRYRRVFLSARARGFLERYLATRKDRDAALFITRRRKGDGSYRMSVKMAQHIVAEAATRAGLSENVSPHWLRHAAITAWAKEESVPFAQRLAGHRNVATTSRYLGSTDAELKERYKKRFG
ncbi:MAG TPA: tyrosine-type recombinase/integrase [Candidatus Limnocylindria bacterium]|jgi:integrase/recombinase XerD|nr:tyrosine-type recombinase/integrase [Candidatus Limnocylindria bacterium]